MADDTFCAVCGVPRDWAQLQACRICRKMYCGDCAYRSRGGTFCSRICATTFYFGDDDEFDASHHHED